MKRVKKRPSQHRADALGSFRKLTRADALLFYVVEILNGMKLKEIATPVEAARVEIAQRLEACQEVAYNQMKAGRRASPSHSAAARKKRPAKAAR
jgi:hypothetical protein